MESELFRRQLADATGLEEQSNRFDNRLAQLGGLHFIVAGHGILAQKLKDFIEAL